MTTISGVKSLIRFQERVLYNGILKSNPDIVSAFNFNKIFLNNTNEMFEKYNCREILSEYSTLMKYYIKNIGVIIKEMKRTNREINFTYESSFEKRRLEFLKLQGRLTTHVVNVHEFMTLDSGISHVGYINENQILAVRIDKSLYEELISDGNTYWKTDQFINEYLESLYDMEFSTIKVTRYRNDGYITKVEYTNQNSPIKVLVKGLDTRAFVICNPFLFINDIEILLKKLNPSKNKSVGFVKKMEVLDLLEQDQLIEYPLDSFDDYLSFLMTGVNNPETKSISITLYRIGNDPSIYNILCDAVERGIKVNVNIELNASGEVINMFWLKEMKARGIHVTEYRTGRMKVHCKITLIEFHNGKSIAQIGTGNYHTKTSTQYTDLSLITSDEVICRHAKELFKSFEDDNTSYQSDDDDFIITGSNGNYETIIEMINHQGELGPNGYICIKCNSLDDSGTINALNSAANQGCVINLIVRGICTWIPSQENVHIQSIVWDKLEHSRVYSFNRINPIIYIGSLDPVSSKIRKRIEVLVRIKDPHLSLQMCSYINRYLTDTKNSWIMNKHGIYELWR